MKTELVRQVRHYTVKIIQSNNGACPDDFSESTIENLTPRGND